MKGSDKEMETKKAAIYARVSSDSQDVDLSISAQIKAMRDYAVKHGYLVTREFIDEAESGRTTSRPAFKEMIALARTKQPPFEVILVWKLNRFSRSRIDSITYKKLLRDIGIKLISINEPLDDNPSGQLLEGVIECIDEFYSANLGQDIKRGMRENAERGFYSGGRAPYGMRKVPIKDGEKTRHKLEPEAEDSQSVRVVRRIFDMAGKGEGCKDIARTLNKEGFRTGTGRKWGKTTIHKILTNEAYAGTLVWGGRPGHKAIQSGDPPVRIEDAWPALIDKQTFQKVRDNMASNAPETVHPRTIPGFYLLSGFLFCECGSAMIGRSAKSHRYYYYCCNRSAKQGNDACSAKSLPKDKLENLVIEKVKEKVLSEDNLESIVKLVNEELMLSNKLYKEKIEAADKDLGEVELRLSKLYDALETGKLSIDELAPRIKQLKARVDELTNTKVQLEADMATQGVNRVDAKVVKEYAQDLKGLLDEIEHSQVKSFLRSFVKRIKVQKDQVTIYYKLPIPSNGRKTSREVLPIDTFGGAEGTRTPDFLLAKEALSQLSYSPKSTHYIQIMPLQAI